MAGIISTDTATTELIDGNDILKAFVYEYGSGFEKWDSTALTYTLNRDDNNPDGETPATWTHSLTQSINAALADLEQISLLTFTEVADSANGSDGADIDFWYYNSTSDGNSGYSYTVAGSGVYLNENSVSTIADGSDGLAYGGKSHRTVIHELLHNVGLGHPHSSSGASYAKLPGVANSGDTGDFALNQNLYTVMSYNRSRQVDDNDEKTTGWPNFTSALDQSFGVLGAFDIAVVQALYGANMTTATGNDIYDIPASNGAGTFFKSIWDAGGTDTFRYRGTDDVRIDLRAATLDINDGMLAGGIASRVVDVYGGFTIANGTVIENAIAGRGDDSLRGNGAANRLEGNGGHDAIGGLGAADVLNGGGGNDSLFGGGGNDRLKGGYGHDRISAGTGNDKLFGSKGRDQLAGGKGNDKLTGGQGADIFMFNGNGSTGRDQIKDWTDGTDRIQISGATVFSDLNITFKSDRTIVEWGVSNKITLPGVTSGITEADFDFV